MLETPQYPRQVPKGPECLSLFLEKPWNLGGGHWSGAASGFYLHVSVCMFDITVKPGDPSSPAACLRVLIEALTMHTCGWWGPQFQALKWGSGLEGGTCPGARKGPGASAGQFECLRPVTIRSHIMYLHVFLCIIMHLFMSFFLQIRF